MMVLSGEDVKLSRRSNMEEAPLSAQHPEVLRGGRQPLSEPGVGSPAGPVLLAGQALSAAGRILWAAGRMRPKTLAISDPY